VLAAQHAARQRGRWLEQAERAAALNPAASVGFHYAQALTWSRWLRRYFRSRFRYDVPNLRVIDPSLMPRTDDEWRCFMRAFRDWRLHMALAQAVADGWRRAETQGGDAVSEALRAYFDVQKQAPWFVAIEMALAPSTTLREEAAIAFSGWAATQIKTRFPRLRKALGGGSPHDVHRTLLERLPAAVLEAFHDPDPNEDPLIVRTHAANILVDGGQRRRRKRPPSALGRPMRYDEDRGVLDIDPRRMIQEMRAGAEADRIWLTELDRKIREECGRALVEVVSDPVSSRPATDTALQDFTVREAVRGHAVDAFELREAVRLLASDYGLSERQAEAYYLKRVEGWPHRRIAERLGITATTSRGHFRNARRKIERAV
jgi:DNA-directed RNA polymerase specialized sigma24 family protein